MKKVSIYLRMTRPAGMVTAMADVLAGVAISGRFESGLDKNLVNILLLCLATAFLYAGGAVYYDVFNIKNDAIEHPKRPLPNGDVKPGQASLIGGIMLIVAIILAFIVSSTAGIIALAITFFILIYAKSGKTNHVFGPLFLGICRGLNLILGISLVQFELQAWWFLALIPIVYVYAVALIMHAKNSKHSLQDMRIGAILYGATLGAILYQANANGEMETTGVFLVIFALLIFIPLSNAIQHPAKEYMAKAAKAGTQYLILMDAAWAITFDSWLATSVIVLLLLISLWLAKVLPAA